MCEYCGCPRIEPFGTLTREHQVLQDLAWAAGTGDPTASDDLRELWHEHLERELAALGPLAEPLGLAGVVVQHAAADATRTALIAEPSIDRRVGRAIADHVDAWEFQVFPHLVVAVQDDDLWASTPGDGARRGGRGRPRSTMATYQTAARAWLTLAGLSLLLPPSRRLGIWLPLHLALAGAVSTAISGAMQHFVQGLTAAPDPPTWLVRMQFLLVNIGAGSIALGMSTSTRWLTVVGGVAFVASMLILAFLLRLAWSRALNRWRRLPMAAYGTAVACVLVGGTFGALIGAGIGDELHENLRRAHMAVNVLGWASLTVVGTMLSLLPAVLRVRMPPGRGPILLSLLGVGTLLQVAGWVTTWDAMVAVGGFAYAAGALGLAGLVAGLLRVERTWSVPLAALHMIAAVAWFVVGSIGLAAALRHGAAGFDAFRSVFLTAFVGGWLVQVLLGAWSFLLPMGRLAGPGERRRLLSVFEVASAIQVVVLNAGLLLMAGRSAGWLGPGLGRAGVGLALAGAGLALAKVWLFPLLARAPVDTAHARAVWG